MPEIYLEGQQASDQMWERMALYGKNKAGKTRLATSIPRNEKWGKIAYIGADYKSIQLRSVLHKEGIIRVDPRAPYDKPYDPLTSFVSLVRKKWREEVDPEIRTIIIDTATQMSRDLLYAYADTGVVQSGHRSLGVKGQDTYHAAPDKGDYGAAQRSHDHILELVWDRPYHLIVLYQETWVEAQSGGLDELVGGPETVGSAQVRPLPSLYDVVLRATYGPSGPVVCTERQGPWPAGIRHAGKSMGIVKLQEDPRHFWLEYDKLVEPLFPPPPIASAQPEPELAVAAKEA